jgi:phosphatidate cytidylyltransferase
MAPDSLFGRGPQEGPDPDDPAEGVRIIDPDEAAEAVERGEAVRRKGDDQPKYGDRPEAPPDDVTPALRFPLSDSTDPSSIDRPRVAPVEPRTAEGSHEPLISVEPATGETELPHWTEPATGEVPRVIIGDTDDEGEEERWASFAASSPRWRDEHEIWHDSDAVDNLGDHDESRLGALDTSDRMSAEQFLTFDDLAVPESDAGAAAPSGSSDDPIRITSSQPRPPQAGAPPRRSRPSAAPQTGPAAPPTAEARGGAPAASGGGGGRNGRDVPQAVFVGIALVVVAVILFQLGTVTTMALVEVVIVLAGVEFFSAVRRGGFRPATLLGLAAVVALPLATYWRGEPAMPLVLFLTFVFAILWFLLGVGGSARPVSNIGITMLGVVYVGVLGSFAALIVDIPVEGVSILFVAVAGAVLYDVGGFFVGRQFGRTPLTAISPNKTVEGLLGGLIASLLGTLVFAVALGIGPFDAGQALVFGLCVAVAAPLGDLAESLFKRDLGLKDMGSVLPGHGGILDRFDGMLFVLPAAYYAVRLLDLAPGL